jgi:hypothetical protein
MSLNSELGIAGWEELENILASEIVKAATHHPRPPPEPSIVLCCAIGRLAPM